MFKMGLVAHKFSLFISSVLQDEGIKKTAIWVSVHARFIY